MTDLSKHRPDFEAEFTPERRAALYVEITRTRSSGPSRHHRLLVALGAAAAVITALTLAVPAIIQANQHVPAAQSAVVVTESPLAEEAGGNEQSMNMQGGTPMAASREAGGLTWRLGEEVDPSVLEEVAAVSAGVGQRITGQYVHIIEVIGERGPNNEVIPRTISESYADADRWTWERRSYAEGISDRVEWYKHEPSPEQDQLPTDPVALDAHFRERSGMNSDDERVFRSASDLLSLRTTPALRAAALRVLANLAEKPQPSGVDQEGTSTNSTVTLNEIAFSDGTGGFRIHFEDPMSRTGDGSSVFINADGIIIGGELDTREDAARASEVIICETTPTLPEEFTRRLGAEQVPLDGPVVDEG